MSKTHQYKTAAGNVINTDRLPILRIVKRKELKQSGHYYDMAKLAKIFNHQVVEVDGSGDNKIWRWKPNLFIDWVHDYAPVFTPSALECKADDKMPYTRDSKKFRGSLDLNELHTDLARGRFTMEEFMKFYMQIGYSLCGFGEVFGQKEAYEAGLPDALKPEGGEEYTETIIEYMIRVHKGKVLKL